MARHKILVFTADGLRSFWVNRGRARRMLEQKRAFVLSEAPHELQLRNYRHVVRPLEHDLSLTVPPLVSYRAAAHNVRAEAIRDSYGRMCIPVATESREEAFEERATRYLPRPLCPYCEQPADRGYHGRYICDE